jgi:hypothetical protein
MRRHYHNEFDRQIAQKLFNHKIIPPSGGFAAVHEQMWLRKWWAMGLRFSMLVLLSVFFCALFLENQNSARTKTPQLAANEVDLTQKSLSYIHFHSAIRQTISQSDELGSPKELNFTSQELVSEQEPVSIKPDLTSDFGQIAKHNTDRDTSFGHRNQVSKESQKNQIAAFEPQTQFNQNLEIQLDSQVHSAIFEPAFSFNDVQKDGLTGGSQVDSLAIEPVKSDSNLVGSEKVAQNNSLKTKSNQTLGLSVSSFCAFKYQTQTPNDLAVAPKTTLRDRVGYSIELNYFTRLGKRWNFHSGLGFTRLVQRTTLETAPNQPKASFLKDQDTLSLWVLPRNTDHVYQSSEFDLLHLALGTRYRLKGKDKWFIGADLILYQNISSNSTPHSGLRLCFGRNFSIGKGWAMSVEPELNYFNGNYGLGFVNSRPYSLGFKISLLKFSSL